MRKHGFGALVLVLALTVASVNCFSLNASAEEGETAAAASAEGEAAVVSVSDNDPGSGDNAEVAKTPLATPTGLAWGDNYAWTYQAVEGCESYDCEIYKDGEFYSSSRLTTSQRNVVTDRFFSYKLTESGTYKFRVRAMAAADDTSHTDSEWSEWSEEKTYVRPDRQVGITKVYWDTEKAGQVNYVTIDNAGRYCIDLYLSGRRVYGIYISTGNSETAGQIKSYDMSGKIAENGEGQYTVRVTVCSADLDQYANGDAGPMSDVYDTSVGTSSLSSILADAMANQSASDAAETLKNSADISVIQTAMQTSDSFRGQVKELEAKYAAEKGISTSRDVSEEAREYVDPDKVEIVGAAFNAVGDNVQLSIDKTPEDKKVPLHENYLNSVQLDIKLTSDSTEIHELEVPVSITMPVPAGINVAQLVILHYHQDGTVERAAFHVNGDGTITFTVREFSTFAFAESGSIGGNGSGSGNPDDIQDDGEVSDSDSDSVSDSWVDSAEEMILSAAPNSVITITKGQGINALSNSAMQALVKRGNVTLVMEYTYQDKEYRIVIPAGKAVDNDITWYGPLYLSAYFSSGAVPVGGQGEYIVKKGDTLGAIARANGMSLAQIAAKNPQIRDVNFIRIGQKIILR